MWEETNARNWLISHGHGRLLPVLVLSAIWFRTGSAKSQQLTPAFRTPFLLQIISFRHAILQTNSKIRPSKPHAAFSSTFQRVNYAFRCTSHKSRTPASLLAICAIDGEKNSIFSMRIFRFPFALRGHELRSRNFAASSLDCRATTGVGAGHRHSQILKKPINAHHNVAAAGRISSTSTHCVG